MDMVITACGAWSFDCHLVASARDSQEKADILGMTEYKRYLFPWKHNLSMELIKLGLL